MRTPKDMFPDSPLTGTSEWPEEHSIRFGAPMGAMQIGVKGITSTPQNRRRR